MTLKIEKAVADEGQEPHYAVIIEHNGNYAKAEISDIQICRRFPELLEELNIKEQLRRERMAQSNIAIPTPHVPRG